MASGPWHYTEGERLLDYATNGDEVYGDDNADDLRIRRDARELAQAHFTAAVAASTALQAALPLIGDDQQVTEWGRAIGATVDTNQGARITASLFQIDELDRLGLIAPGTARKLRTALGTTGGA